MKILTVKIDDELSDDLDELTATIQKGTGLRISRHAIMIQAIRIYVADTNKEIREV